MDKSNRIKPGKKYCTYSYLKPDGEEQQQEVVTILYPPSYTLSEIMHRIRLDLAMEQMETKPRRGDLTFGELMDSLTPEMLAPYGANILRSSVEAIPMDRDATVIGRYEMNSFFLFQQDTEQRIRKMRQDTNQRIRKMRDCALRFAQKLEKEKSNGHPIISAWDSSVISGFAVAWAEQFAWGDEKDSSKFFKRQLEEAKPVIQNTQASDKPVA